MEPAKVSSILIFVNGRKPTYVMFAAALKCFCCISQEFNQLFVCMISTVVVMLANLSSCIVHGSLISAIRFRIEPQQPLHTRFAREVLQIAHVIRIGSWEWSNICLQNTGLIGYLCFVSLSDWASKLILDNFYCIDLAGRLELYMQTWSDLWLNELSI